MTQIDFPRLINTLSKKTDSGDIIWQRYDLSNDKNSFSKKYFSTISELRIDSAFSAKVQDGIIFVIPGLNYRHYLFIQPSKTTIPIALNYEQQYFSYEGQMIQLYEKISAPFQKLNNLVTHLLED